MAELAKLYSDPKTTDHAKAVIYAKLAMELQEGNRTDARKTLLGLYFGDTQARDLKRGSELLLSDVSNPRRAATEW